MEPFKNKFNAEMVHAAAVHLARHAHKFDAEAFTRDAIADFEALELKARSNAIRDALILHLPEDFEAACAAMCATLHPDDTDDLTGAVSDEKGVRGWMIMAMADVVAVRGQDHFDLSMETLRQMTSRFSAEFAVRPFIAADPERALKTIRQWMRDDNLHVRRLASEGSRPRLPWGLRLNAFVDDPTPLLPVLETLRDDPEEYVRRSVANNLNDIAKDHPDLVAGVARDWLKGAEKNRVRLVKHACRSLIKDGHAATLDALGYGPAKVALKALEIETPVVTFGEALWFGITLASEADVAQPIILDFVIHHVKADGGLSPKVFKWKVFDLGAGKSVAMKKAHPMKPITTRKYYNGTHRLEIQVNGQSLGHQEFKLERV